MPAPPTTPQPPDTAAAVRRVVLAPARRDDVGPATLDPDQRRVVDHDGSMVVLGGPGTGKTTTLVEWVGVRASGDASGGLDRYLVLTHGRQAARSLRSQLVRRLRRTQTGATVMTIHGLCRGLLHRFDDRGGDAAPVRLLTAPEQDFRIRELLAGHDTSSWPPELAAAATTRALAEQMRAALTRARQVGLDPGDLFDLARRSGIESWRAVGHFFDEYLDVIDAEGVLDYAELVHRARLLLTDERVGTVVGSQYRAVVVDEFAESDPSQWALVGDLGRLGLTTVVFADPSTRVFGFRGADPRALSGLVGTLERAGVRVGRLDLHHDHRHPPALAAAVTRVGHRLPSSLRAPLAQAADAAAPGVVEALVFDSPGAEADHIADRLRAARLDDGLEWSDMAVICRTARGRLAVLARSLTAAGIPVEVSGDDLALSDEPAVRPLMLGLDLATRIAGRPEEPGGVPTDAMLRFLQSPIVGLDSLGLRRLGRRLRAAARSGPDAAAASVELVVALALDAAQADPPEEADPPTDPDRRLVVGAGRLLAHVAAAIAHGNPVAVVLWQLWSGSHWPARLRAAALGGGDASRRAHRDLDAVVALFDVAARQERYVGERGVRWLLDAVTGQSIPADTVREANVRHRGVRLLTAHRAKGAQWPLVVVCGVQEGSWPTVGRRTRLIDPDQLDPEGLTDDGLLPLGDTTVADERRLFLAAISRATRHLIVTAAAGSDGEVDHPSRFLTDLGVTPQPVHGRPRRPTTFAAVTAELRRAVVDPESPPAVRDAAAERLARLADLRDRSGHPIARGADPATWWGIHALTRNPRPIAAPDAPIELSGSSLEAILRCPRQWFLSRRARAEAGTSSARSLGSLIHVLVQHAVTDGLTLETLSRRLDEVWRHVRFDATWLAASERIEAEAALARFAAWHAQDRAREVLGVEVTFRHRIEVDAEPVTLVGTVDRLERDSDGRVRVVDFKTGRSTPTAAAAAASDQMGLYQLAVLSGAFADLAPGSSVAGADLVYLRSSDRSPQFPKVLTQPSLADHPHPSGAPGDGEPSRRPTWVHDRIAAAVGVIRDERFHAMRNPGCQFCAFRVGCPTQGSELL